MCSILCYILVHALLLLYYVSYMLYTASFLLIYAVCLYLFVHYYVLCIRYAMNNDEGGLFCVQCARGGGGGD